MASKSTKEVDLTGAMVLDPVEALDWLIIAPVAMPLLAGAVLLMLRKRTDWQAGLAIFIMGLHLVLTTGLLAHVYFNGPQTMTMGRWLPPFGISFSVDMLGSVFTATGSLVALLCTLFSANTIDATLKRNGFYSFLVMMMAGVSGAFLTGDIFNLYVWFEVLLIASFGLIIIGGEKVQLDGAVKYTFLNLVATTLFLIATGYLYGTVGTLNMADIALKLGALDDKAPVYTIAALFFVAFAMKAAAFPLNFWLPASYHTPKIVVSALFAGLLTKVGVYALMRTMVTLFGDQRAEFAHWIAWVAALTMVLGVMGALAQSDIRRTAGYLVVSGIGSMVAGIALASQIGLAGTVFYAVHSMLVMTAIYFAIGVVGARSGTFEMRELGGHYAASPFFAAAFLVLAVAVSGLPPFSGFWPKFLLVKASLDVGAWWLAAAILVTGLLTSIAIFRVWAHAFWRGGPQGTRDGAEAWTMQPLSEGMVLPAYIGIGTLVALTFILGIAPDGLINMSLEAARTLLDPADYIDSVFGGTR